MEKTFFQNTFFIPNQARKYSQCCFVPRVIAPQLVGRADGRCGMTADYFPFSQSLQGMDCLNCSSKSKPWIAALWPHAP